MIARLEPAILQHIGCAFRIVQITFENVYSAQPKHSGFVQRKFAVRFRFANFRSDAGRHFANRAQDDSMVALVRPVWSAAAPAGLRLPPAKFRSDRSLQTLSVEAFLEILREIERQFFRAGDDETQAAKLVRFGFAQVTAQKSGRRQQER